MTYNSHSTLLWYQSSLKCTYIFECLSYSACMTPLSNDHSNPSSHWGQEIVNLASFCRRWWHRELSLRQHAVPLVTYAGVVDLMIFSSQCSFIIIFTPVLLRNLHNWNLYGIFAYLFYYAWLTSLLFHTLLFSLKAGFVDFTALCRWWHRELSENSLRCHHWCWSCRLDDLLSSVIFPPVLP